MKTLDHRSARSDQIQTACQALLLTPSQAYSACLPLLQNCDCLAESPAACTLGGMKQDCSLHPWEREEGKRCFSLLLCSRVLREEPWLTGASQSYTGKAEYPKRCKWHREIEGFSV